MKENGIKDLLDEVELVIKAMADSKDIRPVRVKSCLEHMRSCLEYMAVDIFEKVNPQARRAKKKIYFPYGKESKIDDFIRQMNIPQETSTSIKSLISSVQPYKSGDDWLVVMCNLTNDAKHREPIPLEKEEVITGRTITAGGVGIVSMDGSNIGNITIGKIISNGVDFGGIHYDNNVLTCTGGDGTKPILTISRENKITFRGKIYEVIPFLNKCHQEIGKLSIDTYKLLQSLQ